VAGVAERLLIAALVAAAFAQRSDVVDAVAAYLEPTTQAEAAEWLLSQHLGAIPLTGPAT